MICSTQVPSVGGGRMATPWRHGIAFRALKKIRAALSGPDLEPSRQALYTITQVAGAPNSSSRITVTTLASSIDRPVGLSAPTRRIDRHRSSVAALASASAGSRTERVAVVLGIESSCDDTGVAVVTSDGRVLGEAIATQADLHAQWGGVVPNLARDAHTAAIDLTVDSALAAAGLTRGQLTAIAVTVGPGLGLCLRVGAAKARDLARQYGIPLISVHHMEAHALVARLPAAAAATAPPAIRLAATLAPTETAPVGAGGPPAPNQLTLQPDETKAQPPLPEKLHETNGTCKVHEAKGDQGPCEGTLRQKPPRDERSACVPFLDDTRNGGVKTHSTVAFQAAASTSATETTTSAAEETAAEAVAEAVLAPAEMVAQAVAASGKDVDPTLVLEQIEGIAEVPFPFLCLLVSGGHNLLVLVRGVGSYLQLGSTMDDALGEAYDKVARLLNLELRPHGGAALEALAREGDPRAFKFKVPMRQHATCDFSFAGLKTSTRLAIERTIPTTGPQAPVGTLAIVDASSSSPQAAAAPCSSDSRISIAVSNGHGPMSMKGATNGDTRTSAPSSSTTPTTTSLSSSLGTFAEASGQSTASEEASLSQEAAAGAATTSAAVTSEATTSGASSTETDGHVRRPMSAEELRRIKADIAASFQSVAVTHLLEKTRRAVDWAREVAPELRHLVVAGGVASNKVVRESLRQLAESNGLQLVVPPARWCTDNGVMVAWAGLERLARGWAEPPPPPKLQCSASPPSSTQGCTSTGTLNTEAGSWDESVGAGIPICGPSEHRADGMGVRGSDGRNASKEGQEQVEEEWIELKPRWPLTGELHPRAAAARKEDRRSLKRVRMHVPLSDLTPPSTLSPTPPVETESQGLGGVDSSGNGTWVDTSRLERGLVATAVL